MAAGSGDTARADGHQVVMYGLSTCGWCKKMKMFLEDEKVDFDLIYVDQLEGAERNQTIESVRKWNPAVSFPTVVVDDETVIVGYRPDEVKEALGL
jgi:glutaredoxin-like protein NrdH